jgi:protein-disulfide isomerase
MAQNARTMTDDQPKAKRGARLSVRSVLDVMATCAMLAAACLLIWTIAFRMPSLAAPSSGTIPLPNEPIALEGAPILGSAAAKVAIIEFSDFECPFCGQFSRDVLPSLRATYIDTGRVKLAFRHLPLVAIHPRAAAAAEAAECAARQGGFWELHDAFFADPKKLQDADIAAHARRIGLDEAAFSECVKSEATSDRVRADLQLARAVNLKGTPAFLLGVVEADGRVQVLETVSGAQPVEAFSDRLDVMLAGQ